LFVSYGCSYAVDLASAVGLDGDDTQAGSAVITSQDVTQAVFTNQAYTDVALSASAIVPASQVYVGLVVSDTSLILQAMDCLISTTDGDTDTDTISVLSNGCGATGVTVFENTATNQVRFDFDADQLRVSPLIFNTILKRSICFVTRK